MAALSIAAASAQTLVGDANRYTFSTSVAGVYESNAEGRRGGEESYLIRVSPRFRYERIGGARFTGSAELGVDADHAVEGIGGDHQNVSGSATLKLKKGAFAYTTAGVSLNYLESNAVNEDVNRRLSSKTGSVAGDVQTMLGARVSLAADAMYSVTDTNDYAGQDSASANVDLRFLVTRRTQLSALSSYTYTVATRATSDPISRRIDQTAAFYDVGIARLFLSDLATARVGVSRRDLSRSAGEQVAGPLDRSDTNLSASLTGPFLPPRKFPKLTSNITLQYGAAPKVGLNDNGGAQMTGSMSLGWQARRTTRLRLLASRVRDLTVTNLSSENTQVTGNWEENLTKATQLTGGIGYEWTTIRGDLRKTEALLATVSATTALGTRGRWSTRVSYVYREAASTVRLSDISQHTATAALNYSWSRGAAGTIPE
ncbi:MAG: hypothetical protein V4773_17980 [Verrucomicrobiota bacterium]